MVVAEGSRVFLEAEAFDSDGNIDEVRFYGNGNLLGSAPLGNVLNVRVINPGFGFVDPPVINFIGGGGFGATATASLKNGSVTAVQMVTGGRIHICTPSPSYAE